MLSFYIVFSCFRLNLRAFKSGTCIKIKILMAIWWSMIYNDDEGGGDELLATDKWWSRFCDKQLLWEAGMYSLSGEIVARVCSFVTHSSLKYITSKQSKHRHPSLSLACVLVQLLMRGLMSCNLLQIVPLPSARHQNKRTSNPNLVLRLFLLKFKSKTSNMSELNQHFIIFVFDYFLSLPV